MPWISNKRLKRIEKLLAEHENALFVEVPDAVSSPAYPYQYALPLKQVVNALVDKAGLIYERPNPNGEFKFKKS